MFLNSFCNSHVNILVVSAGLQLKCQSCGGCQDQLLILLVTNSKFNYFHQDFSQHSAVSADGVVWQELRSISIWDQILSCFYSSLTATPAFSLRYFNSAPSPPIIHLSFLPPSETHIIDSPDVPRVINNSVSLISLTKSNRAERMTRRGMSLLIMFVYLNSPLSRYIFQNLLNLSSSCH